jgi:L-fucose mutarotase/ribose pyranase (RbsD/FucU family)
MSKSHKLVLAVFLVCLGLSLTACEGEKNEKEDAEEAKKTAKAPTWEDQLLKELPALGHRNWLVVADSAFPAQISPGMEVVVSNEDHFAVLEKVLRALGQSKHIRPIVYLDKELDFVPEDQAPGIDACRKRLKDMLSRYGTKPVLHEELIARMDQVAKTFRILMIKTNLTLPYTTVFMELDCGYWGPESEAKMREKMKEDKKEQP